VIVFVAGGMTYSEMREVYLLSQSLNKDIIIGSTHTITPTRFIEDLVSLELEGTGSRALPNGLRSDPNQPSLQAVYDQKYPTAEPAPPEPRPQQQALDKGNKKGILTKQNVPPVIQSSTSNGVGKKKKKRFF